MVFSRCSLRSAASSGCAAIGHSRASPDLVVPGSSRTESGVTWAQVNSRTSMSIRRPVMTRRERGHGDTREAPAARHRFRSARRIRPSRSVAAAQGKAGRCNNSPERRAGENPRFRIANSFSRQGSSSGRRCSVYAGKRASCPVPEPNDSDSGPGESWFEPRRGNSRPDVAYSASGPAN